MQLEKNSQEDIADMKEKWKRVMSSRPGQSIVIKKKYCKKIKCKYQVLMENSHSESKSQYRVNVQRSATRMPRR